LKSIILLFSLSTITGSALTSSTNDEATTVAAAATTAAGMMTLLAVSKMYAIAVGFTTLILSYDIILKITRGHRRRRYSIGHAPLAISSLISR